MIPRDLIKQRWCHCPHFFSVHSSLPHPQSEPLLIFPFSTSHPPRPAVSTPTYAPLFFPAVCGYSVCVLTPAGLELGTAEDREHAAFALWVRVISSG